MNEIFDYVQKYYQPQKLKSFHIKKSSYHE